jgi:hypothetical protein
VIYLIKQASLAVAPRHLLEVDAHVRHVGSWVVFVVSDESNIDGQSANAGNHRHRDRSPSVCSEPTRVRVSQTAKNREKKIEKQKHTNRRVPSQRRQKDENDRQRKSARCRNGSRCDLCAQRRRKPETTASEKKSSDAKKNPIEVVRDRQRTCGLQFVLVVDVLGAHRSHRHNSSHRSNFRKNRVHL